MEADERQPQKPDVSEELYKQTKQWTYKGKPTNKARKLKILEQGMAEALDMWNALLKR